MYLLTINECDVIVFQAIFHTASEAYETGARYARLRVMQQGLPAGGFSVDKVILNDEGGLLTCTWCNTPIGRTSVRESYWTGSHNTERGYRTYCNDACCRAAQSHRDYAYTTLELS